MANVTKSFQYGNHTILLETGEIARQAGGAAEQRPVRVRRPRIHAVLGPLRGGIVEVLEEAAQVVRAGAVLLGGRMLPPGIRQAQQQAKGDDPLEIETHDLPGKQDFRQRKRKFPAWEMRVKTAQTDDFCLRLTTSNSINCHTWNWRSYNFW